MKEKDYNMKYIRVPSPLPKENRPTLQFKHMKEITPIRIEEMFTDIAKCGWLEWEPQEYEMDNVVNSKIQVGDTVTMFGSDFKGIVTEKTLSITDETVYTILGFHDSSFTPNVEYVSNLTASELIPTAVGYFLISCLNAQLNDTQFQVLKAYLWAGNSEIRLIKSVTVTGLEIKK